MDACDLPESFPSLKLFSASASELAAEPKGVGSMQSGIVALAAGAVWFGFVWVCVFPPTRNTEFSSARIRAAWLSLVVRWAVTSFHLGAVHRT